MTRALVIGFRDEDVKQVLEKVRVGDGLTDVELDMMLDFYEDLSVKLQALGPKYQLAWHPVYMTCQTLKDFKAVRERNRSKP